VTATRAAGTITVSVRAALRAELTLGAVLPAGATVAGVLLDGRPAAYRLRSTARGSAVLLAAGTGGQHALAVVLR